jgi:peptide/nickel transport system substrate-binding protein
MRRSTFPLLVFMLVSVSAALLSSCRTEREETPSKVAGEDQLVLRVGATQDDYLLDPKDPGRVTVGMGQVNTNIFETLTSMDRNFRLQPMLALSWEYVQDRGVWRFHLRRDVSFHNGQRLGSGAVVETMNRVALNKSLADILKIDQNSTRAVDEYAVDIAPTTVNMQLPAQLTHPIFGIRAAGSDPIRGEHIGTGPFVFVDYVKNSHITVEKNTEYWDMPPRIDRIEFRFIPDVEARTAALLAEEVDLVYSLPLSSARKLSKESRIRALPSNVSGYQGISCLLTGNETYTLTQDILIREAIGYGINRELIIEEVFLGFASSNQTLIPPAILEEYGVRIEGYRYDPKRAVTVLEAAGWHDTNGDGVREKNGKDLKLELIAGFPDAGVHSSTPAMIQSQLRGVGILVTVVPIEDTSSYERRLGKKQGDLWLEIGKQNSIAPCFLPGYLYYGRSNNPNLWQRAFAPGPAGWPSFDEEIDLCFAEQDLKGAVQHVANAMHVLIDEARAFIPIVGIYDIWFSYDRVLNFQPHPNALMVRWNAVSFAP